MIHFHFILLHQETHRFANTIVDMFKQPMSSTKLTVKSALLTMGYNGPDCLHVRSLTTATIQTKHSSSIEIVAALDRPVFVDFAHFRDSNCRIYTRLFDMRLWIFSPIHPAGSEPERKSEQENEVEHQKITAQLESITTQNIQCLIDKAPTAEPMVIERPLSSNADPKRLVTAFVPSPPNLGMVE